ncbi:phage portal protein family protein [Zavarzinella formosa]|uniref:phage portal protein family protein n=1 Tax=Zavarzinella formosa TaxID=360055 RepID=UPI0002E06A0C|nr:hypothetical protein [Zavarzinella formosa]
MASDTPTSSEIVRLDPAAFLQVKRQTAGYRPHLLSADRYRRALDGHPWFTLREADAMRHDPQVTFGLRILRAALYQVKVNIAADDKKVGQFVQQQFQKIWRRSLRQFLGFFEYGVSVGEISYATEKKRVVFDRFDPVHPRDARPLEFAKGKHRGQFCGIRVRGHMASDCKGGEFDLLAPHAFWFSGESEYGSYWSQPRMAGAYEPWLEKRGRHGAVQSRQLWFKKGAFSGGSIRYPVGRTSYDNGDGTTTIDNQDLARQIAEDVMSGAVMSLPSTMDKNGQFLWVYEPPKAGNEVRNILEYPQELDKEILIGMGIPPELVSAATVGSGYSGRAIPAQMFFSSCDEVVHLLVDAIDRQILRNLVVINFGRQCYQIIPDSLAEKVLDDNDKSKAKPKGDDKQPVQLSLTARQRLTKKIRRLERLLDLDASDEGDDSDELFSGPLNLSTTYRAPKGGISIAGKQFIGGEFIPRQVLQNATAEDRRNLRLGTKKDRQAAEKQKKANTRAKRAAKLERGRRISPRTFTTEPVGNTDTRAVAPRLKGPRSPKRNAFPDMPLGRGGANTNHHAKLVADVLNSLECSSIRKDRAITVIEHADGTVTLGLSGPKTAPQDAQKLVKALNARLVKEGKPPVYSASDKAADESDGLVCSGTGKGAPPGNCSEAHAAKGAGQNRSRPLAHQTVWGGKPGTCPKDFQTRKYAEGKDGPEIMRPCPTCRTNAAQGTYDRLACTRRHRSTSGNH